MRHLIPYAGAERRRSAFPKARHKPAGKLAGRPRVPSEKLSPDYIPDDMRGVLNTVCLEHKVTLEDLRSRSSRKHLTAARAAFTIACLPLRYSLSHISRVMNKDHSCAAHYASMAKKKGMYTAPVEEDILSPTERRVYDMYSSNYTYTDMSEELGVSYASVRKYMTSARRKLRLSDTDHDIVEDLLLWAPRVSTVLEMKAAQVLIRAAEEIKQLRERVNK